jgi:hypothetical protein
VLTASSFGIYLIAVGPMNFVYKDVWIVFLFFSRGLFVAPLNHADMVCGAGPVSPNVASPLLGAR